jgi:thymidylate synthase
MKANKKDLHESGRPLTQEEFINKIKTNDEFAEKFGELGKIYGHQWRSWEHNTGDTWTGMKHNQSIKTQIDQIANLINDLKTNPDSRRLMVNAWNVGELDSMVLPPCHYGFQVYTRELSLRERNLYWYGKNGNTVFPEDNIDNENLDKLNVPKRAISLMWNQRSVDTFLGLPFNIASYGLLLEIIAKAVNMVPDELIGNLGDTHLYLNHIEQAKEQIGRELSLEERNEIHKNLAGHMRYHIDKLDLLKKIDYSGDLITHEILDELDVPKRKRQPYPLPTLKINSGNENWHLLEIDEVINSLDPDITFKVENYQSHPTIKAPLSN